ncbi:MAG: hypothetical protein ACRDZ9_05620 [Acidimicrobiales bacterium]
MPAAAAELSWPGGESVRVGWHPSSELHPSPFRLAVVQASARGWGDDGVGHAVPRARILTGPRCHDLGGGVYRFAQAGEHLDVFTTTLPRERAHRALREAATLPVPFRPTAPPGVPDDHGVTRLEVRVHRDALTAVSLVCMRHRPAPCPAVEATVGEVAWALAGACAAAEVADGLPSR